jgi:mannose-6-phosphate isomerase-like protein (cupin superfamily)
MTTVHSNGLTPSPIDLKECFSQFSKQWEPKRIAAVNDYDVKIVKMQGDFIWHSHPDTDELFLVVEGHMTIRLRASEDAAEDDVTLAPGQIFVVPRGVQHCPTTTDEALVLMFEPQGTPNTGDAGGERTRETDELP